MFLRSPRKLSNISICSFVYQSTCCNSVGSNVKFKSLFLNFPIKYLTQGFPFFG